MRLEEETKRAFIAQTWELTLDRVGAVIELPRPPLQSVTKIEFVSDDGTKTEQSSDTYIVDSGGEGKGRIILKTGCSWIYHRGYSSVIITFVTGYGDSGSDMPEAIRRAILLYVAYLYENRGDESIEVPINVRNLIAPYKVIAI